MTTLLDFLTSFFCALFGFCEDAPCRVLEHAETEYIVCRYSVEDISVRVFLNDETDRPYAHLSRLTSSLPTPPKMTMNGGMYHDDLGAVGLYVERGVKHKSISTKGGWGNFHLLPNGVFWGKDGQLFVSETHAYIARKVKPDFATQSGPMLVINGKLHPRFLRDSDSRKIRNGVGISRDGKTIHFAISKRGVTFWNFGQLFRQKLKSHNALFLDGSVSAIKTSNFQQGDWRELGPMIGVFAK